MPLPAWMHQRRPLLFVLAAALVLFAVNNLLLARVNQLYLGGSATGAITTAFLAFLMLSIRARGVPPLVFLVYGACGLTSHLLAGDAGYVFLLVIIIACAALYDLAIARLGYHLWGIAAAFPLFVVALGATTIGLDVALHPHPIAAGAEALAAARSVALGWCGILAGAAAHTLRARLRRRPV
jgi:hypothetical protein